MLRDCNACMQIGQDGPPTKHSVQQLPLSCIVHLLGHLVGSLPLKHGLSRIANVCLFLCYHTCPDSRVLNSLVGGSSVTVTGAVSLSLQNAVYMYFNHRLDQQLIKNSTFLWRYHHDSLTPTVTTWKWTEIAHQGTMGLGAQVTDLRVCPSPQHHWGHRAWGCTSSPPVFNLDNGWSWTSGIIAGLIDFSFF